MLNESVFTIKFVAFKTPSAMKAAMPIKFYFSFKFFTEAPIETPTVIINNDKPEEGLKFATQYYLVVPEQLRLQELKRANDFNNVLQSVH